ncbi:hypothetical protein I5E68_07040 [Novosphingobium sp. YJ-S2-02]|uniref:Uncharacterized protein n=1 Tax=Novosphingobium aureum TaxID=2792964 RepID=A0A931MKQ5_9SPHN|nr:hypothetical protein [Novosphingobium aureum]MBH0112705.1 hypothetical protein [Novosphingobium aureum]
MSRPDAAASAALDGDIIRPGFFAFLDIAGNPVRINTLGRDVVVTGSGFNDMDDHAFIGTDGKFVEIGSVTAKSGGSDQLTCSLSGLRDIDDETLNIIGDQSNWIGRSASLWRMIRNADGAQQGAIQHYYTGYMVSLSIEGDESEQTIKLGIEGYLSAFSQASNRTYLDQELFDPGDLSASAAIAIANGTATAGTTPIAQSMLRGNAWGARNLP